jgi:precorrin-4/cobalt-precorrin-4 C11-methyltransferase
MTVHFIGAGPGAPDLLTLRGRDLVAASPVCLYAGSLIPRALLDHCPPGARVVNSAPLTLDEIIEIIADAHAAGQDVARLHSGDLSIWSAMGEQLRRLRALGIPFTVTPGVPSFAAAAAALEAELTLPGLGQSLVLTRTTGRASAMPPAETLAAFGATGATLAIHLSVHNLAGVVADLIPLYGSDCPAAIVWRASWPDQSIVRSTLATLETLAAGGPERTALILVGRVLGEGDFAESSLYAPGYDRRFRPSSADSRFAGSDE